VKYEYDEYVAFCGVKIGEADFYLEQNPENKTALSMKFAYIAMRTVLEMHEQTILTYYFALCAACNPVLDVTDGITNPKHIQYPCPTFIAVTEQLEMVME
jgi:hypothetical protein